MSKMKFVFCEGGDDVSVVKSIARTLALDIVVEPFLGKDNLANFLRAVRLRPDFAQANVESVAIVRDADANPASAFASVRDALILNGFDAPRQNGDIEGVHLRCGILIIPHNKPGMIEDLCLESVAHLPEYQCVDAYFRCIADRSSRKAFSSKAKLRVWMASHVDHEYYVGKAAEAGYFPWDSDIFAPLKAFLQRL